MYGTAFEHNLYYQYNFQGASNVFMGAIQTETPYFQPSTFTPFAPTASSDPVFCTDDARCNMSLSWYMSGCNNIFTYGTGLYSFFNTWSQDCLKVTGGPNCQKDLVLISGSTNIYTYSFNTYGSQWMLTSAQAFSVAQNSKNTFCSTAIMMNN